MDEIKITDTIIIDEPGFVETAIKNLTGKTVDFTVIKKFILSEKNTKFYINHKLNSSIEPNIYSDFLWLDTGIRDFKNNPIMICLHSKYDGRFIGHYTETVRQLANWLKKYKRNNSSEIEKNLQRFLSKYRIKASERQNEIITDSASYIINIVNSNSNDSVSLISKALDRINIFLPESHEEYNELISEAPFSDDPENMIKEQNDITIEILLDQIQNMQNHIDELLTHVDISKKESQKKIQYLSHQNKEYKKAFVNIRTFLHEETPLSEESNDNNCGHDLLSKNEKILVLGNADIHIDKMRAIAHDDFGFEKSDFEFITDYPKIKNYGNRMHKSIRFAAILFGNCPHKVANMGAYNNLIAEFKERACCPIAVDARNKAGALKITKNSFRCALKQICVELKEQAAVA